MGGPAPVELTANCTTCGLEGGLVEHYDPLVAACRFGLPATSRCKLCGIHHEARFTHPPARPLQEIPGNRCPACLDVLGPRTLDDRRCASCGATAILGLLVPATSLASEAALVAALDAWATREHWPSREALTQAVFCDPDLASLLARIARGEPLEVIASPQGAFAPSPLPPLAHAMAPAATTNPLGPALRYLPTPPAGTVVPIEMIAPVSRPTTPPPASAPPRAIVYPLVSVIAADGEIHPAERALINRFLESEGLAPLAEDEFRVHHPSTVAHLVPPDRREMVVQLMCETASVDGMPDDREKRVIRDYAAAWNVPHEKVEFWMWGYENMSTSVTRQLWIKLRRFVLAARWTDPVPGRR